MGQDMEVETVNALAKPKPAQRCPEYLAFVRSLRSVLSGHRGCVAHHRIGDRCSTLKTSDFEVFPLEDSEHKNLHDAGWREWERKHGTQWSFVNATQEFAIIRGLIVCNEDGTFTPNRKALKRAVEY